MSAGVICIEVSTFDKLSYQQRLLYYFYLFHKDKEPEYQKYWDAFRKDIKEKKNYDLFVTYVTDEEKMDKCLGEQTLEAVCEKCLGVVDETAILQKCWNKVIYIIRHESKWEQQVYQCLEDAGKKHPLVAKLIVLLLTGILTGIIANCIYDGITMPDTESVQMEEGWVKLYLEEDDCYKLIYFSDEGEVKEEHILKENVRVVHGEEGTF